MIRLILADDHPVFVSGLRAVLDAEPDLDVTAVAATGTRGAARAPPSTAPTWRCSTSTCPTATGCR